MDRTTFLQSASLEDASYLKRAALLCEIWFLVSLLIAFAPVTHPEFGLNGDLSLHYHITRSFARSLEEGYFRHAGQGCSTAATAANRSPVPSSRRMSKKFPSKKVSDFKTMTIRAFKPALTIITITAPK